jgi:hypothetical protein
MASRLQRKRARKHLLVAAMGVATVSYVSTQSGCAPGGDGLDEDPSASAPYDDEQPSIGVAEQALGNAIANPTGAAQIAKNPIKIVLPPVGNLMAPPVGNLMAPPPVGNLMAPPIVKEPIEIVPVLPPVGNLMAPPVLEETAVLEKK